MNEDKELFLPDTTVKLGTLKKVLNDVYGLDVVESKKSNAEGEEPKKKGMSKGLKIGLIVGGSLLTLIIIGVVIHQSTKEK
jgi:hypothetical protein